jgi:ABC-2 type transport system ATP-binding protein
VRGLTDRDVRRQDAAVILTAPEGDALLPAAVRALDAAGLHVSRATGVPPTLDDVFLGLTGRTLREAGEGEPGEETEQNDVAGNAASVTTGAQ